MKKIICIVLCLLVVTASFAGCMNKPKTFEEAAAAGKEFIKNDAVKDVKAVTEADGNKFTVEGQYDPKNEKAVFSVSIESKDTVHTFKDLIKKDGNELYIKIPDMSVLEGVFGGIGAGFPGLSYEVYSDLGEGDIDGLQGLLEGTEKLDLDSLKGLLEGAEGLDLDSLKGLLEGAEGLDLDSLKGLLGDAEGLDPDSLKGLLGSTEGLDLEGLQGMGEGSDASLIGTTPDYTFGIYDAAEDMIGRYIKIKLPENKPQTTAGILSDAEDDVYEKAEKLEAEEDYPYVVKYSRQSAYDLIISVLDGIKAKKNEVASELSALVREFLGEENFKSAEELAGKPLSDLIADGIDEFFKNVTPEDIAPEDAEKFDVIQKIAYDTDKKLEYVFLYDLKDGEETHNVKTTLTVTAAGDADLSEKCSVAEEEIFDLSAYLKETFEQIGQMKEMFGDIKQ